MFNLNVTSEIKDLGLYQGWAENRTFDCVLMLYAQNRYSTNWQKKDRESEIQIDVQRQRNRQTDRGTNRLTDRPTERPTNRPTDRQTDRPTDRQTPQPTD